MIITSSFYFYFYFIFSLSKIYTFSNNDYGLVSNFDDIILIRVHKLKKHKAYTSTFKKT